MCTTPWDSYLIRHGVWSYSSSTLGIELFDIPVEEVFFFIIQTYMTSVLYLLFSKPTLHPIYLAGGKSKSEAAYMRAYRRTGFGILCWAFVSGLFLISTRSTGLYAGYILTWSSSFGALLWCVWLSICALAFHLLSIEQVSFLGRDPFTSMHQHSRPNHPSDTVSMDSRYDCVETQDVGHQRSIQVGDIHVGGS